MPTVAEIMDAEPVTVSPEMTIEDVVHVMKENELTGVPVVNGSGRCVGIITENDLVIGDEEGDLHIPHYIELMGGIIFLESLRRFEGRLRKAAAAKARDMMTEDPVTVAPDADANVAAKLIVEHRHDRLPVVEGDGTLVGVVTRLDVLEALAHLG